MSPVPPIAHLVAIALGLFGAFQVIPGLAPDLPDSGTEPGVAAPFDQEVIKGGDADSLLQPGPLEAALEQLDEQLAAGEEIKLLDIKPDQLNSSDSGSGEGFSPSDVEAQAPQRIIAVIASKRPAVKGLDSVQFMQLRATPEEPRWYVQLTLDIFPPRTYGANLDGSGVVPGS